MMPIQNPISISICNISSTIPRISKKTSAAKNLLLISNVNCGDQIHLNTKPIKLLSKTKQHIKKTQSTTERQLLGERVE